MLMKKIKIMPLCDINIWNRRLTDLRRKWTPFVRARSLASRAVFFEGFALAASNAAKVVLYSLLLVAAVYWGLKGDFVDFWDAFLWLVAFAFIELNIFEWRREESAESATVME